MALLYDTNTLLLIVRDKTPDEFVRTKVNPITYLSWVSVIEIQSIAFRQQWGKIKLNRLDTLLSELSVVDIKDENIVEHYISIDAYSQRSHPTLQLNISARNMGKHDIWIAATASYLGLQLITTDKDFDHLHNVFLKLNRFDPSELISHRTKH